MVFLYGEIMRYRATGFHGKLLCPNRKVLPSRKVSESQIENCFLHFAESPAGLFVAFVCLFLSLALSLSPYSSSSSSSLLLFHTRMCVLGSVLSGSGNQYTEPRFRLSVDVEEHR